MYNNEMTNLDKFYSDADRLMTRASVPGSLLEPRKCAQELIRLYMGWARDYGTLGTDLAEYWEGKYANTLTTPEGRKSAIEWFGALLSLLAGQFEPSMNFSNDDWSEIRDSVNAEAEELDIELLSSIMTIIVDRGQA